MKIMKMYENVKLPVWSQLEARRCFGCSAPKCSSIAPCTTRCRSGRPQPGRPKRNDNQMRPRLKNRGHEKYEKHFVYCLPQCFASKVDVYDIHMHFYISCRMFSSDKSQIAVISKGDFISKTAGGTSRSTKEFSTGGPVSEMVHTTAIASNSFKSRPHRENITRSKHSGFFSCQHCQHFLQFHH